MNPIALFSSAWGFLKGFKFFWALLRNWSQIQDRVKRIEKVVQNLRDTHRLSPDDAKDLLEQAEWLFNEGFIDIPGVDEEVLVRELAEIRANIDSKKKIEVKS